MKKATSKDFLLVQKEGQRDVKRNTKYYSLDIIIAVGFKVNSKRAIDFRLWAINVLKQYSIKGYYVLDKERLKNGTFLDENYFDELLQEIREIRISERNFYQKITDICLLIKAFRIIMKKKVAAFFFACLNFLS